MTPFFVDVASQLSERLHAFCPPSGKGDGFGFRRKVFRLYLQLLQIVGVLLYGICQGIRGGRPDAGGLICTGIRPAGASATCLGCFASKSIEGGQAGHVVVPPPSHGIAETYAVPPVLRLERAHFISHCLLFGGKLLLLFSSLQFIWRK